MMRLCLWPQNQETSSPAYTVVPKNAPEWKIHDIELYDCRASYSEPTMESRQTTTRNVSVETGALFIPSSNDARIIRLLSCKIIMTNNNENIKYAADLSSIKEARERISSVIHRTPVLSSKSLNEMSGKTLVFKCECFQKGGAFKFRGASNAVLSLDNEQAAHGVVTHSSGNHAAALSLAARSRGIPAYIVVPDNAPKCKIHNIERYGGHVSYSKPTVQSRQSVAAKLSEETGALFIPSSNDARIISGQGTIALELIEEFPDIDMIIAPISGGGLISGVAIAAKALKPEIKIVAAEPIGANDLYQKQMAD